MPIKHVLIVDDSKAARLVLSKMLRGVDLTVDTVASGEEALDYLMIKLPDAIFMDHTMPGMDGLQAVKVIKDNPRTQSIPIAMYTSKEGDAYVEEAISQGAVGVLPKPATADTLQAILDQLNVAAAAAPVVVEPVTAGPTTSPLAGYAATPAALEKLVQQTATVVVGDAIHGQILPLLEERLARLRDDLAAVSTAVGQPSSPTPDARFGELTERLQRLAGQLQELQTNPRKPTEPDSALVADLRARLLALTGDQINRNAREVAQQTATEVVNAVVQSVASQVYDQRAGELSSKLAQRLGAQLTAIKAQLQAPPEIAPEVLLEVRNMAQLVAADRANECAREVAEQTANDIVNKLMGHINRLLKFVLLFIMVVILLGGTFYLLHLFDKL